MDHAEQRNSHLTRREEEVLELTLKGLSYRGIGDRLNIKPGTVRNHISNLLSKFQTSNRTELVLKVINLRRRSHRRL